jgi:3-oxoadipate enol-lactonase
MNWIEANGISQRYELGGRGDEVVILVHEMGGMLERWDEALPGFQQHFRVLRYDQRGFGMSEKPVGKVTLDDLVADLAGLLDALGITAPCHVVSSALGTAIAMAFAARHPKRVARMAIASAVTGTRADSRAMHLQRSEIIERGGMRASMERSLARSYPEALRGNRQRFERFRRRWLTTAPASYVAMADMVTALDLEPELANIACPTLVIGAKQDTQRPPALMKEIAAKIRGARYVEADSGHFMAVETPDLFVEYVVPFLRGR